jgi:transposase
MTAPRPLRPDHTAGTLRRKARQTRNASQTRRLLALATIYDGGSRSDAARVGGGGLQIVRDWVVRFNAEGLSGLVDRKAPGRSLRLDDAQREALAVAVERGPTPASDGVVRWRLVDLAQGLWDEFQVSRQPANARPHVTGARLPQAVRPAAPPCPGGRGGRAF